MALYTIHGDSHETSDAIRPIVNILSLPLEDPWQRHFAGEFCPPYSATVRMVAKSAVALAAAFQSVGVLPRARMLLECVLKNSDIPGDIRLPALRAAYEAAFASKESLATYIGKLPWGKKEQRVQLSILHGDLFLNEGQYLHAIESYRQALKDCAGCTPDPHDTVLLDDVLPCPAKLANEAKLKVSVAYRLRAEELYAPFSKQWRFEAETHFKETAQLLHDILANSEFAEIRQMAEFELAQPTLHVID